MSVSLSFFQVMFPSTNLSDIEFFLFCFVILLSSFSLPPSFSLRLSLGCIAKP